MHDTVYKSHFQYKTGDGTQCFSDIGRFETKMVQYKKKEFGAGGQWRLKSFERTNLDESGEPVVETVEIRVPMDSGSDTDSE